MGLLPPTKPLKFHYDEEMGHKASSIWTANNMSMGFPATELKMLPSVTLMSFHHSPPGTTGTKQLGFFPIYSRHLPV